MKCFRYITIDLDTKDNDTFERAKNILDVVSFCGILIQETKRGYHLTAMTKCDDEEEHALRLVCGDDIKRLKLDKRPEKRPKNVLFDKKTRVKKKW